MSPRLGFLALILLGIVHFTGEIFWAFSFLRLFVNICSSLDLLDVRNQGPRGHLENWKIAGKMTIKCN